jgi:hypothetical protein
MKIFICSRTLDSRDSKRIEAEFSKHSEGAVAILHQVEHSDDWKKKVEPKLRESDFVVFLLGIDTFQSDALKWEYAKSKMLNKRIIGIKLSNTTPQSVLYCEGFQVFEDVVSSLKFMMKTFEDDRVLLLDQYKMMASSTEKVIDQRLTVNNLFFTITSSILSVALIVGKAFEFSIVGTIGMLVFSLLAMLVSFFWAAMIQSYGNLNTGKFLSIDEIEKRLRTNMFEREWKVLREEVKYKPNTQTERSIIRWYQRFIGLLIFGELIYFVWILRH